MMSTTNRLSLPGRVPLLVAVAVLTSGCTVQEVSTPTPVGVSELGIGMSITAAPEFLPRDGSSMSTITLKAFDSNGDPIAGQRFHLEWTAGTLSASEVATGSDGTARLSYIAPGLNENVSVVRISATPFTNQNLQNANPRFVDILVSGPAIPVAAFNFTPPSPAVLDTVTFDARSTWFNGSSCGSSCSYSWNFGDGSSGSDIVTQHAFTSSGVFNVTLTATSLAEGTSNSVTKPVVVEPPAPPVANFTTGPCATPAATCFRFTDASTVGAGATITGYLIDFGDNTNAATMPAERTYAASGTYNVRLTVQDSLGRTATTTRPVVVP